MIAWDDYKKTFKEKFEAAKDDEVRWKLVLMNHAPTLTLLLGNDDTSIVFQDELELFHTDEDAPDPWLGHFEGSIGNSSGTWSLLDALNIEGEYV